MKRLSSARPWLVLAGGDFVYKGIMAVYWVLLARKMSIDGLGIVALANAIAMPAFIIIDAGLNTILVRDYSESGGLPKAHRARVTQRVTLSVLLLAPLAGLGFLLDGSLEAALATGFMAIAYFCDFTGQLMLAPTRAMSKMEPDAAVRTIQAVGTVFVTLVFIYFSKISPSWIAFASTVAYAVAMYPAWRVWRRSRKWSTHPASAHVESTDEAAVSHGTVLMSAFGRADSILVQIVLGPAALASYTVAYKLLEVARLLPAALSRIVLARSSDSNSASYHPRRHLLVSLGLALAGTLAIVVLGPSLLGILFGDEYRELAAVPAQIMGLSIVPFAIVTAGTMYAIGTGNGRTYRRIAIESLLILLVTVTVLAEAFGLEGAAVGMLLSQVYSAIRFWSIMKPERFIQNA